MARNTADVLKLTGAVGLPDPTLGSNSQTQGFWGLDVNSYLLAVDNEFALTYAGNPNGLVAANYVGRQLFDTTNKTTWRATVTGNAATAVWMDVGRVESVDVRDFGAIPDAKGVYDIVCTNGSNIMTSATANFPTSIVGKSIKVYDIANGTYIGAGTVTQRDSATQIRTSFTAAAAVSAGNGYAYYGTDNATAINNALTAAGAMVQQNINGPNFPHGTGHIRVTFPIDTRGSGYLFGKTLRPGRNIVIDADAMLFSNTGNGAANRVWAFQGTGWHVRKLIMAVNGGMGVDMGTLNINASSHIENLQLWTVGTNYDSNFVIESATIQAGGSGYAVNDTITLTGGTGSQAQVRVTAVNSGAVTAVEPVTYGSYSVKPSNPVSQGSTSGSGTGCTLNITWAPNAHIGLRLQGYDYHPSRIWIKGGNIGVHFNQVSDIFCGIPMELIGCSVSMQATSVENAHIEWVTDTGSFLAGAIDGSRNARFISRAFSVVATTLTYGIQIGEYDAGNKCRGIWVDYMGQRTGGTGAKVSNCEDSIINLQLSNAALFSGAGGDMTTGVQYGSGNVGCITVNQNRDGAISTMSSGTVVGQLNDYSDGIMTQAGPTNTGQKKIVLSGVTNDTTFIIPANHYIQDIIINNTTANAITGGIKIGTTSGATDIVNGFAVGANAKSFVPDASMLKRWFSTSSDQTCYLQDVTSWNSANLTVTVVYGNL